MMPEILAAISAAVAVLAFFLAAFWDDLTGETALVKRLRLLRSNAPPRLEGRTASEEVAAQLKLIDQRAKARKKLSLLIRIQQAGLSWTVRTVVYISMGVGLACALAVLAVTGNPLFAVPAGIVAGYVLPLRFIAVRRNKRIMRFAEELPNALDVIARGVIAGRSIADCIRSVAREQPEPLRSEFRIVEAQAQSGSLTDAIERLAVRVPIDETRFLAVAIGLQSADGGGIAETMRNLSTTLRERFMARKKLATLTAEYRWGAKVLAGLPLASLGINYSSKPEQTALMWTTTSGLVALAACAVWICIGFVILNRMATFKV